MVQQVLPTPYSSFTQGRKDALDFQAMVQDYAQKKLLAPYDVQIREAQARQIGTTADQSELALRGARELYDPTINASKTQLGAEAARNNVQQRYYEATGNEASRIAAMADPAEVNVVTRKELIPGMMPDIYGSAVLNPVGRLPPDTSAQVYPPSNIPNNTPTQNNTPSNPANSLQEYLTMAPTPQLKDPATMVNPDIFSETPPEIPSYMEQLNIRPPTPQPPAPQIYGALGPSFNYLENTETPQATGVQNNFSLEPTMYDPVPTTPAAQVNPEQQIINSIDAITQRTGLTPEQVQYTFESDKLLGVPIGYHLAKLAAESNFNPKAVSKAGAQGIAQLMPGTAKSLSENLGIQIDPFNVDNALMAQRELNKSNLQYVDPMKDRIEEISRLYQGGNNRKNWGEENARYYGQVRTAYEKLFGTRLGAKQ